jgi:hypothetical protein
MKLGEYRKPKPTSGRKCALCGSAPAGIQFVEVNWFRGDDVAVPCCDTCKKTRKDEVMALGNK